MLADQPTSAPRNRLLAVLPPDDLARLRPRLEAVELPHRQVIGFLLAAMNSLGVLPAALLGPLHWIAAGLTAIAMAALGLGVDVRALGRVEARVSMAVGISLL